MPISITWCIQREASSTAPAWGIVGNGHVHVEALIVSALAINDPKVLLYKCMKQQSAVLLAELYHLWCGVHEEEA